MYKLFTAYNVIYHEQIRWKVFIILINISIEINGLIDTILPGEKYVLLQNMGANKKSNKNVNKGHSEEEQENKKTEKVGLIDLKYFLDYWPLGPHCS